MVGVAIRYGLAIDGVVRWLESYNFSQLFVLFSGSFTRQFGSVLAVRWNTATQKSVSFQRIAHSHALISTFKLHREEHIARKIDTVVKDAKAKLAKGDKKGTFGHGLFWS